MKPRPCRYCGELIVFALTRTTTRKPFDAKPRRMYQLSGQSPHLQARQIEAYVPHVCAEREPA